VEVDREASVQVRSIRSYCMIIVLNANARQAEIDNVVRVAESLGCRAHVMPGASRTAVGLTGNGEPFESGRFANLPGVTETIRITNPLKLTARDGRREPTIGG